MQAAARRPLPKWNTSYLTDVGWQRWPMPSPNQHSEVCGGIMLLVEKCGERLHVLRSSLGLDACLSSHGRSYR